MISKRCYDGLVLNERTRLTWGEVQAAGAVYETAVAEWDAAAHRRDTLDMGGERWGIHWDYQARFRAVVEFEAPDFQFCTVKMHRDRYANEAIQVARCEKKAAEIRRAAAKLNKLIDAALANPDRRMISEVDDWAGQIAAHWAKINPPARDFATVR